VTRPHEFHQLDDARVAHALNVIIGLCQCSRAIAEPALTDASATPWFEWKGRPLIAAKRLNHLNRLYP